MIDELKVFNNEQFGSVRVIVKNDEPWFVGRDIAGILGYKEAAKAVREHVDEDDKGVFALDTPGGRQQTVFVNESGMYSLILGSKLPTAKQCKHWVTSEILPSIRKHGGYISGQENMSEAEFKEAADKYAENVITEKQRLQLQLFSRDDYTVAMAHQALVAMETKPLLEKIEQDQPKVAWAEIAQTAKTNIKIREMAKLLKNINGIDTGEKKLYKLLRAHKVIMTGSTLPYQEYVNRGYFVVEENHFSLGNDTALGFTTKVTPHGQQWLSTKVPEWLAM